METKEQPKIVVYSMGPRVSYIGECVLNTDEKIVLKRVLSLERQINPQTGESSGIDIAPVMYAARESTVTILKSVVAGMLIEDPDAEVLKHYDKEIIACYSKLKIS